MTRKRKYVFASFNNDRRLSLDDKTKDCVGRNTGSRFVHTQSHDYVSEKFQRDKVPLSTPPLTQH